MGEKFCLVLLYNRVDYFNHLVSCALQSKKRLLNAFYTYKTGKQAIYHKEAILVDKGSNVKTGTDYIHLLIDGRQERFNPKKDVYENLTKRDTLLLTIGKGKTTYDKIYEFNKK